MTSGLASQRRRQYRADTRRGILDAAEALLVEEGVDAFSMRRLAGRCGCTAPTLYHYFRDKPTLVAALLQERLERLVKDLERVPHGSDAMEDVLARTVAFARWCLRHPSHYQLLVVQRGPELPDPPAAEEARRLLAEPLEALVQRGDLPARSLEGLRQGLWSLVHGYILLQTTHTGETWEPGLLETSLDAMIRGTLARAGQGGRRRRAR